ncbi:subtype A tannase [Actinomyces wuliandei]|uniref:subtype A tannase n=1 Tax=Actinomyces wuliandei TaxID=2057743 RepID=UPI000FD7537B|nr:subtype A tannase [Actinomyces wuliandei]
MEMRRRTFVTAVPAATAMGVLGLAACSAGGSAGSGSSAAATQVATTSPELALDSAAWSYDSEGDVYYQLGVSYVADPQAPDYETLCICVPGPYMEASDNGDGTYTAAVSAQGSVADLTAQTAPVVLPVNTPGYSAQAPLSEYSYETVQSYMEAGLIYVHVGLRGKDSTTDSYSGNAPWGVADLKAAVRYLRYNADLLPGDTEKVYVFGHSGGGAQSAVAGASGDSDLYAPYLAALGAATTDAQGNALSDAVAGAMCWCPITSLDSANGAYEWNMGQFATTGTRAEGTWTRQYSLDLAAAYAEHLSSLGLADADGNALTLEPSDDGVYLSGTYYDHLVGVIETSLNDFLEVTTFPYTPSSTETAGMGSGAPSGEAPASEGPQGSSQGKSPEGGTETPSEGGTPLSGQAPSGDGEGGPAGAAEPGSAGSSSESTTYETVEDYIAYLNTDTEWVTYDASTNTATVTGLAGFVTSQKPPSKDVGAFDGTDRGQTENLVMGVGETSLHFSTMSQEVLTAGQSDYSSLEGWSEEHGASAYEEDMATTDSEGVDMVTRVSMYDPMYYLAQGSQGYGTSSLAPAWRIRTGITQGDTASTVEVNLALALERAGVSNVDFATVWGQGHTMAELTGTGEENFIAWVKETAAA